jgi:ribonuclease HI
MSIELWTDGACSGNPGPGGWAYVIAYPDGTRHESSGSESDTTNNRMELTGPLEGLRAIATPSRVKVVTDASYVEQAFSRGWIEGWRKRGWERANAKGKPQELKNVDLWQALYAQTQRHVDVTWSRVRGHNGHALNERCDVLATAAVHAARGNTRQVQTSPVVTTVNQQLAPTAPRSPAGSDPTIWWWTAARGHTHCECGAPILRGRDCAYRHTDRSLLCQGCVVRLGLRPRPSKTSKGPPALRGGS